MSSTINMIQAAVPQSCNNQNQKQVEVIDNIVTKAENTIRRTTLQNAAKTPGGAVLASARYIVADAVKDSLSSKSDDDKKTEYLKTIAAIKSYSKNDINSKT